MDTCMGYIGKYLKLKKVWDIVKIGYRLICLTECDIFSVDLGKFKKTNEKSAQ